MGVYFVIDWLKHKHPKTSLVAHYNYLATLYSRSRASVYAINLKILLLPVTMIWHEKLMIPIPVLVYGMWNNQQPHKSPWLPCAPV